MSMPTTPSMARSGSERSQSQSRLSLAAVDSADVTLDERKMYAVEWRDQSAFGFTVTPVNSDRGTVLLLARRTARREQLEAAGLQDVVPGDLLVAIGDEKVYHLGADHAATYLRSVPKPVRLTLQLSPYGNQAKQLPDLAPNEYHYLWEDGPLGIVLTYDPKSKLPMVKRLSDKATDVVRRDVAISDQLMYCNDVPTSEYSMDEVMSILREMPKPVLLRFRKQLQDDHLVELPDLAENEYEFLWDYGPLGLVIGMSRRGLPFVRSFTGLGTSRQLNLVQEDDEIVMVNDKSARDEGFRETMQYLMNVPKPAVLRFRRKVRHSTSNHSLEDRASQSLRESSSTTAARPSTPGYQQPAVPDCVGPLSPVAPLGASVHSFDRPSSTHHHAPLSPQVRVSLDRSRFRSVSSAHSTSADDPTVVRASGPLVTIPSPRASGSRTSTPKEVGAASPARQTQQVSDDEFEDARSPQSSVGTHSEPEDRETAILPPDPTASRSSIFTFQFEDAATRPPTTPSDPPRPRRISAKTGSMPPDPVVELPMGHADGLARSQSSRPVGTTLDTPAFVPLPASPDLKEQTSVHTAEPPVPVPEPTPTKVGSSRGAKPSLDTAELVAEPVTKPETKSASQRINQNYVDTAELVADAAPVHPPSPVDNQREVGARNSQPSPPPVKTSSSPSNNQIEDTAELVAEPTPPVASKVMKKSYVDTADFGAEPQQPLQVEKPATKPKTKKEYIDTAELFAEPVTKMPPAPKQQQQYTDTADLVAAPLRASSAKKAYVDTADLVAVPASTTPSKPKAAYIDTAELFAEPSPPKPAAVATPASAPAPPTPVEPKAAPANPPVKSAPAPAPAPAPTAPVKTLATAESQEYFTVDPAAFYTIQWTDGPFGSTVREADSTTGPIMLITKRTGKQTCKGLRRIAVGDILVRIGDKEVSAMGFEKATRYLRKVTKPVPLTFQAID